MKKIVTKQFIILAASLLCLSLSTISMAKQDNSENAGNDALSANPSANGLIKFPSSVGQTNSNSSASTNDQQTENNSTQTNNYATQNNTQSSSQELSDLGQFEQKQQVSMPTLNQAKMKKLSTEKLPTPYIESDFITIGTGHKDAVYYSVGGSICRVMNRNIQKDNIQCAIEPSNGSVENINLLKEAKIDYAMAQSDLQAYAYNGVGMFTNKGPFEELRFVFSLHDETMTIIVRRDSKIKTLDDLEGKAVNIGQEGSGTRALMDTLMQIKGWDKSVFQKATTLSLEKQIEEICNKNLDAITLVIGHPNTIVQETLNRCDLMILNLDDPIIKTYVHSHPEYTMTIIPAGMYVGEPQDIHTFGMLATLLTSTDSSDENVYKLTKSVFENFDNFKKLNPVFTNLSKQGMAKNGRAIPYHPGATKYYKETGYIK